MLTRNSRWTGMGVISTAALGLLLGLGSGCGDDSPGGNNSNTDGGGVDAMPVDAGSADAWTFECPESQPAEHTCIRGQVRRLVDDSPVAFSTGSTVQRFVPLPNADYPTELQAEAAIQPDGRFIFPSAKMNIRQDVPEEDCPSYDPDCYPFRYDYFDLVVAGDTDDASSYRTPLNRYGLVWTPTHPFPNADKLVINYYLISDRTLASWEALWPGLGDPGWSGDPRWCPLDPDRFAEMKLIIPVCYDSYPDTPDWFPSEWASIYGREVDPAAKDLVCQVELRADRLTYYSLFSAGEQEYDSAGIGLFLFDWQALSEPARIGANCSYSPDGPGTPWMIHDAFMTFSTPEVDDSGDIVVAHRMASFNNGVYR